MKDTLGLLAIVLAFVAYTPYLRDIFAGRTIPHPYSWFAWGFSSALIFALQITHGAGPGGYVTAVMAVICIVIAVLSYRNGVRKQITHSDGLLFAVSLTAAILWLFVDQPVWSIVLLAVADVVALIPSIRKAYGRPFEETMSMWAINGLRHGVALAALTHYNIVTILDPLVWVILNVSFVGLLILRRRKASRPRRLVHRRAPRHK